MWYPPAIEQKSFPTAALSTSGIRVEGDSFLSACFTSSPVFISVISIHRILQKTSTYPKLIFSVQAYPHKISENCLRIL